MNKTLSLNDLQTNEIPILETRITETAETLPAWPEPESLPDRSKPEPFPLDCLPEKIRAAIEEAQRNIQAPVAMVAASALSALSLACQSKIDVARNDSLTSPVSLFSLVIAESGDRKSSADKAFTDAIRQYQNEITERNKPLMQEYCSAFAAWQAERDGILRAIKQAAGNSEKISALKDALTKIDAEQPKRPHNPQYLYQNFSIEGLRKGLSEWPSAGIFSSEAGSVFGGYGMRRESALDTLGTFNSFWSGEPISFKRLVSESGDLQNCRLTVSLAIQQGALDEFLRQSGSLARSSGFWARCLIVQPESLQGFRPYAEPAQSWNHVSAFNARIREILDQSDKFDEAGRLQLNLVRLSPGAKRAWTVYYNQIESELKADGEMIDVRDFASKSAEQAARIAALLEYFCTGNLEISLESMQSAAVLAGWYLVEAQRYFGLIDQPENERNAIVLENYLREKNAPQGVSKRLIQKSGPHRLRKKEKLEDAIQFLFEHNRARLMLSDNTKVVVLNPRICEVTP
ncbi:MAG TPA: YfjI family protein [Candidatus Rifleibacterium sp.]|nr:YfjI family protein [Candidatus Rifleibacterium sp.]HPT45566.1 YfjI family protein [Candidatus Rifleibacterium sp.]